MIHQSDKVKAIIVNNVFFVLMRDPILLLFSSLSFSKSHSTLSEITSTTSIQCNRVTLTFFDKFTKFKEQQAETKDQTFVASIKKR